MPPKENTGRSVENRKAHPDGRPCPSCKSTDTEFRFFNNKKKTQPRYRCLACLGLWTEGGKPRGPYNKRSRAPEAAADGTSQPPVPQFPPGVRRRRSAR